MIPHIHIDIETRSACDLVKRGVYNYAEDSSTEVLCVCYFIEGDDRIRSWIPGEDVPDFGDYIMVAHNAAFERIHFEKILGPQHGFRLPRRYVCTMAISAHNGYPLSLDGAARALGLDAQKDKEGALLMRRMCKPLSAKVDPESVEYERDLHRLVDYCKQDVRVECEIFDRLKISETEQRVYEIDQKINDRGVPIDCDSVHQWIQVIGETEADFQVELARITDGAVKTPKQVVAMRSWLEEHGVSLPDLRAETVAQVLSGDPELDEIPDQCRRVLKIRQLASLSSIGKYPAMLRSVSKDGRARGLFAYCGAYASGRWAGRRIQLQNLPHLEMGDSEVNLIADLISRGDSESLQLFFGEPLDLAKQMLRPMVRSDAGLVVGDWSSIELRVAAWLANQKELLGELFAGVDTYKSMASTIFGVPITEVTKDQRQIGKSAVLGCGYGLGWQMFYRHMINRGIRITEALAERAVNAFRIKNYQIKNIWYALADAALLAWDTGHVHRVGPKLAFGRKGTSIGMQLPSGRVLQYHNIEAVEGKYGRELTCSSFSKTGNPRKKIYGGLFFENACQAVARDLLAETLIRCEGAGLDVVAHVHDEILVEGTDNPRVVQTCMEVLPPWAEGLPIKAECFSCKGSGGRYTK